MSIASNKKVLCLIVTYNRLQLLKECIKSVKDQDYQNFDILIVNNGSTDGTYEYLHDMSGVYVIHQDNCGGAGGFYAGMKYLSEHKEYAALWMMDDDGFADSSQLSKLVMYSDKYNVDYANALVVRRDDPQYLSDANRPYDKEVFDKKEFIEDMVCPFNGTFINRSVIDKIGCIKKEMFIWGDEREYTLRVSANGFTKGTVTQAIHYHPPFKGNIKYILGIKKWWCVSIKPKGMDRFFYRNLGYIDRTYNKNFGTKYKLYYISRLKFKDLAYFIKYYKMGWNDDFSINFMTNK